MKLNVAEVKRNKRTIYVVVSGEVKAVEVKNCSNPMELIARASMRINAQTTG